MTFSSFFYSHLSWFLIAGVMLIGLLIIEWKEKGHGLTSLSTQQSIRLLNDKKTMCFDVRANNAFNQGHITSSKNINTETLEKNPESLIKKKDTAILLICEHGNQAIKVGKALKTQGFVNVNILQGGLATWRKESLPLEVING